MIIIIFINDFLKENLGSWKPESGACGDVAFRAYTIGGNITEPGRELHYQHIATVKPCLVL